MSKVKYDEAHRKMFHSICGGELIKTKEGTSSEHAIFTCSKCKKDGILDGRPDKHTAFAVGDYSVAVINIVSPEEAERIYQETYGSSELE